MKTRRLWFGATPAASRVLGPAYPAFPDTDVDFSGGVALPKPGRLRTRDMPCGDAKAFALAPDGDCDLVKVFFDGAAGEDHELLGPGRIIRRSAASVRIEPVGLFPGTRAAAVPGLEQQGLAPASGWVLYYNAASFTGFRVKNISAVDQQVYRWLGSSWNVDELVTAGSVLTPTGASSPVVSGEDDAFRFVDFGPDGVNNFADLALAGVIPIVVDAESAAAPALSEASFLIGGAVRDSNGNPGADGTYSNVSTYRSGFNHQIEPAWLGRAGLLTFDECPGPGEVARLLPERRYSFKYLAFADLVGQTTPMLHTVLACLPLANVESVAFTWNTSPAARSYAAFGFPTAYDLIDRVAGVQLPSPLFDNSAANVAAAIGLSSADFKGAFLQILLGTQGDATPGDVLEGAELVIRRRFIGG